VSVQGPIRLDDHSEPEPDVTLLRPEADGALSVARASEALLVVEVSNTTLAYDRNVKRDRYAQAGIPEVWIVALEGCYIEAAHTPVGGVYTEIRRFTPADPRPLVPQLLAGLPPLDLNALFRGLGAAEG
jgi:Uma2 family endonuclease